jgi:hypothetical protein
MDADTVAKLIVDRDGILNLPLAIGNRGAQLEIPFGQAQPNDAHNLLNDVFC